MDELLTVDQAAKELGIWPTLVRRYAQQGRLAGRKMADVWLFRREDVEAFKGQERRPGKPRQQSDPDTLPRG